MTRRVRKAAGLRPGAPPVSERQALGLVPRARRVRRARLRGLGKVAAKPVRGGGGAGAAELRVLSCLPRHPAIPRLIGVSPIAGSDGPGFWILTELVRSPLPYVAADVRALLQAAWAPSRAGPVALHPRRILRVIADAGAALAHCHRHGVVHGDVKAANILVCERFRGHLCDFGSASLSAGPPGGGPGDSSLSSFDSVGEAGEGPRGGSAGGGGGGGGGEGTGGAWDAGAPSARGSPGSARQGGTAAYMAPEYWLGEPIPASDVYSLGVTLWECAVGQEPWKNHCEAEICARVAGGDVGPWDLPEGYQPWHEKWTPYLSRVMGLVQRCTSPWAQERPPAGQVARELEAVLANEKLATSPVVVASI